MNIALIFPGQGAQKVGMGREFYESSLEARAVFDKADSVLAATVALSFEDTLKLVERRSFYMEEAVKVSPGKMAAIIGLDKETILEVCQKTGVEVANFNSPQQIVITGHAGKVEAASKLLSECGAKSVIPLDVGGAFHSSLMRSAAEKFSVALEQTAIAAPRFPVISNVDGQPAIPPGTIRKNLAQQITSSVQWVDSIMYMAKQGIRDFIEIGPGKILKGLIRRIDPALNVYNIETPADIGKLPW